MEGTFRKRFGIVYGQHIHLIFSAEIRGALARSIAFPCLMVLGRWVYVTDVIAEKSLRPWPCPLQPLSTRRAQRPSGPSTALSSGDACTEASWASQPWWRLEAGSAEQRWACFLFVSPFRTPGGYAAMFKAHWPIKQYFGPSARFM